MYIHTYIYLEGITFHCHLPFVIYFKINFIDYKFFKTPSPTLQSHTHNSQTTESELFTNHRLLPPHMPKTMTSQSPFFYDDDFHWDNDTDHHEWLRSQALT